MEANVDKYLKAMMNIFLSLKAERRNNSAHEKRIQ
jgi:hypothetical protein